MVSKLQSTPRPLPFKYPAECNTGEDLTRSPNTYYEGQRFIYRDIANFNC